jgi:hypothetical protein
MFSLPYLVFILPPLMLVDLSFMSMGGLLITSIVAKNASAGRAEVPIVSRPRKNLLRHQVQGSRPTVPTLGPFGRYSRPYSRRF